MPAFGPFGQRTTCFIPMMALSLLPWVSLPADAAAYKLFADPFESEAAVQEVLRAPELTIIQASESTLPCEEETRFGVLYVLEKGERRRVDLVERWHHPHVTIDGKDYTDNDVQLRFGEYMSEPRFTVYELLPMLMTDGRFRLEVLADGEPILEHAFAVDCPDTDGQLLVCQNERKTGTRVPVLTCRTQEQIREEQEELRRATRNAN